MLILPEDEVHLWFAFAEDFADPEVLARPILASDEMDRLERLRRKEPRRLFALSRFLVRTTLSRYFPFPPEAWHFSANSFGQPRLAPPRDRLPVRFSLSHTVGLVVFALTSRGGVGVDAERRDRVVDASGLGSRFFSPEEAAWLRGLPPERSSEAFLQLWTLKESLLKALGRGFSLPMNAFSFRLSEGRPRSVSFSGNAPGSGEAWRFFLIRPEGGAVVAVSASRPAAAPLRLVCRRALPSGEATAVYSLRRRGR